MLAIEVNFLTGRFVATAHNDREASEWPPHPARLFSALVAGWAEAGEDDAEREVLEWLEAQPAPSLAASEADPRKVVSYFVPVNDAQVRNSPQSAVELFPEGFLSPEFYVYVKKGKKGSWVTSRVKQERHFPSVTPVEPRVTFVWPDADLPEAVRNSLDNLLNRVTRLGHSSSLVSCRLVDDPSAPNWSPGSGAHVLRCTGTGQLAALRERFQQHQAIKPRSLPFSAVRYSEAGSEPGSSPPLRSDTTGDWIVFEFLAKSRRFPASRTVEVASAMRAAIMSHADDPIPEGLSGHQSSGTPTLDPHVAFLPLPYVGFEHADARIMGLAMSLPESLDDESRRATLRAIGHWEQETDNLTLTFGNSGILQLQRRTGPIDLVSIRPELWQKSSLQWVSATPVALPTHPGPLSKGSAAARSKAWDRAEQAVVVSCRHVGLPEPAEVELSLDPFIRGARPAADFPPFRQRGRNGKPVARRLVHVALTFGQHVQGPLMLGAGRFLGLGLMRPTGDSGPTVSGGGTND